MDRAAAVEAGECRATDGYATFTSLVQSMGTPPGWAHASPVLARVVVRSLLTEQSGALETIADDPWAVRAVHRALLEMRSAGLTATAFAGQELSEGLGALVALFHRYEEALADARLFDDADHERHAVLCVARNEMPAQLAHLERITVEGGTSLFGSRLDLLRAFCQRRQGPAVQVQVRMPWDGNRPEAFAWPEASLHSLEWQAIDSTDGLELCFDDRTAEGPLSRLRAAQLCQATAEGSPARVVRVPATAEHGRAVAAEVLASLRAGVPPHEIAVVTTAVDTLGADIAAALRDIGVPSYLRGGPPLTSSPPAQALLSALRLGHHGCPREELIDLWLTLGRTVATPAGPWDPARVAGALRRAGVRSTRVSHIRQALVEQAEQEERFRPESPAVGVAHAVADALEGLLATASALPERADLRVHLDAIEAMANGIGLVRPNITGSPADPDGAKNHRRSLWRHQARIDEGIDALLETVQHLRHAAAVTPCDRPWGRDEMTDTLALALSERCLAPTGMRTGAVAVMAPEDVVETRFRRIVFAGVDAGSFPRAPMPDPVLTDALRAEVNRLLGPRLLQTGPIQGRGAIPGDARDTWLWLEVLAACQEALVVTFSNADCDGDEGRSELVDELLRSLGPGAAPEPASPSYNTARPATRPQLVQRWALGALARTAAAVDDDAAAALARQTSALQRVLEARQPEQLASVRHRVHQERRRNRGDAASGSDRLPQRGQGRLQAELLDRMQSTSRLDTLAMCGFRHFAQAVLGLELERLPTLGADPREQGSAAHAALHVIYEALRQQGGLQRAARDPETALAQAEAVFEAQRETILSEVRVHPLLRQATLEQAWAAVRTLLEEDLRRADGLEPVGLEHPFGFPRGPSGSSRARSAPFLRVPDAREERCVQVRGVIDRVDFGHGTLVTLDYKRSTQRRSPGRHLQLPLYAAVALRDFGAEAEQLSAFWATLSDGKRHRAKGVDADPDVFQASLRETVWARVDRALSGNVSPDPDPVDLCARCDYWALCRYHAVADSDEGTEP